jgi:excisionase family DNA binding protein
LRDAAYVAGLLGIPRKSVLQYAREGKLPSVRIGRHVRFVIADVQAAIDTQRPKPSR